jgi:hypothetical protein
MQKKETTPQAKLFQRALVKGSDNWRKQQTASQAKSSKVKSIQEK